MTLYTTLHCRMQEKCHNQWIQTNIWKGNNHIISITSCSHIKMFSLLDSTKSRTNYTRRIQHIIKMTHSQECSLLRVESVCTFCHHTASTKSTINDTTFSSGIIKKRKTKTAKELPFIYIYIYIYISYMVLFLTLNILRLSATSQIGHKPMSWRPVLLSSSVSMH